MFNNGYALWYKAACVCSVYACEVSCKLCVVTSSKNCLPLVSPATEWGLCVPALRFRLRIHCWVGREGGTCTYMCHRGHTVIRSVGIHTVFACMKFLAVSPLLSSRTPSYHGLWLSSDAHRRLLLFLTDSVLLDLSLSSSVRESPWSGPSDTEQDVQETTQAYSISIFLFASQSSFSTLHLELLTYM